MIKNIKQKYQAENQWAKTVVFTDKKVMEQLKKLSIEKNVPVSRLIAIALDNEMESPNPFNYPVELPTSEYIPYGYVDEAGKILTFLMSLPAGTGLDSLMLCRREIGINDKETFMLAVRELLEKDLAEMYTSMRSGFGYAAGRVMIRYKNVDPETGKRLPRARTVMGESIKYQRAITDDQIKRDDDGEVEE